jgi:hypothetical protein
MKGVGRSTKNKLTFVNHTMTNLNDCVTNIYESLVDEEYDEMKSHVKNLQLELRMLLDSVKNEMER